MGLALTTEAVQLALGMAEARAQIASSNIANAHITGFRPQRIDFSGVVGLLREADDSSTLSPARLYSEGEADLRGAIHTPVAESGNVDLAGQVADLTLANLDYRALTEGLNREFAMMQLAIGGKG